MKKLFLFQKFSFTLLPENSQERDRFEENKHNTGLKRHSKAKTDKA
ncbi:MAG: hypothetical protein LBT25_01895 [Candidatus Symbiothrix sp.]|jgi:hypothetical protein|nr:hypothetical protein [Candidatus Symbiothrix sp.]